MSIQEHTPESVAEWLRLCTPVELNGLLSKLPAGLKTKVLEAMRADPEEALRLTAAVLRAAKVPSTEDASYEQFATEVEDVLGRVGRAAAIRRPTP